MNMVEDFIIENGTLMRYRGTGGEVTIPDGVVCIHSRAFSGCDSITAITLPAGVSHINSRAFAGCVHLTRITLPATLVHVGTNAFAGCPNLKEVRFPGTQSQFEAIPLTTGLRPLYDATLTCIPPAPNP